MNAVGTGQMKGESIEPTGSWSLQLGDTMLHITLNTQPHLSSLGSAGRSWTLKNMLVVYNYKYN